MKTMQQSAFRAFVKRHPVLTFYFLVFALQVGLYLLAFLGTGFLGTGTEAPTSVADLSPLQFLALLPGSLAVATAAILVIGLAFGRGGFRELRSRLFRRRVGLWWYAVALLTAPVLMTAILYSLSLTSPAYLPTIIRVDNIASLLMALLVAGLLVPIFEELGWTGFATPELRKRHGVLATGGIVGLLWAVWHVPLYLATDSGAVPLALYVPVMAFAILLPYRVLMVWVYDHTQSVVISMLMHMAITVYPLLFLNSPAMVGKPDVTFNLDVGAALWVIVAVVLAADRMRLGPTRDRKLTRKVPPSSESQHSNQ